MPESIPKAEVLWYHGSSAVSPDSDRVGITQNGTLIFAFCLDNDVGIWECRVQNHLVNGDETTTNIYLLKEGTKGH